MKHKRFLITLALLSGLTALTSMFLALSGQAAPMRQIPQVLHVAPDGMCGGADPCFDSVQAAVDAAAHSDEIRIATGNYTDTHVRSSDAVTQVVYISKTLTLRGGYTTANALAGPPDPDANPTTLDAQGRGRVFYISGDVDVTIEGLHITGGDAHGLGGDPLAPTSDVGGGVYGISATVTLRDCQISGNTAPSAGGGVYLHGGDPVLLIGNTIFSNTTQGSGGGVHISWNELVARLDGNTLYNNEASLGGGVYLWYSHADLRDNTIHSNQADDGAGVYLWTGTGHVVWLQENVIFDNAAARWGGGVHLWDSRDVTLYGNSIFSNTAQVYGGGVWLNFSLATLASNAIHHNQALAGGGVYMRAGSAFKTSRVGASPRHVAGGTPPSRDDGPTLLINNAIVENQAGDEGSGLYIAGHNSRLLHNTIARNGSTGGNSSGVYIMAYQGTPALYSTVALTNTLLADQAVGIGVAGPNTVTINGVLWHNTPVTVSLGTASLLLAQNQHTGDPVFASDGYHLTADSAAIDKGVYAGVTYDIDGDARALEQPDLGADEWQRRVYLPIALHNHDPGVHIENLGRSWSEGVALGDVDGDGKLEALFANYNQATRIWLDLGLD
jgi:parallel beta-helix repeat protein